MEMGTSGNNSRVDEAKINSGYDSMLRMMRGEKIIELTEINPGEYAKQTNERTDAKQNTKTCKCGLPLSECPSEKFRNVYEYVERDVKFAFGIVDEWKDTHEPGCLTDAIREQKTGGIKLDHKTSIFPPDSFHTT